MKTSDTRIQAGCAEGGAAPPAKVALGGLGRVWRLPGSGVSPGFNKGVGAEHRASAAQHMRQRLTLTRFLGKYLGVFFLAFASMVAVAGATSIDAEGIEVRNQAAQNRFPEGIQFTIFLGSNAEITSVRLRYRVLPDGINVTARPQCSSGSSINCTALVGSSAQSYMVPGAEVVYFWEIEDAAGGRLSTPEERTTYQDTRYKWESATDGNITVFFYQGSEQSSATVLRTARETIDRFSQLEGTRITFPVKIYVYQTSREMQPAIASRRGSGPDNSVATLGEVSASDTALVSRDTDFLNIVRHELTHIVTRAATQGSLSELPVWINEGLSTYAQRELLPGEAAALELALKRNQALPLLSLSASARGSSSQVSIFYAQSGSVVAFMVDKLGPEKFAPFLQAMRADTLDNALKKTYGLDLNGLENEWRKAVGLPPIDTSAAGPSSSGPSTIPTIVPFGAGGSSPGGAATPSPGKPATNSTSEKSDGGSSSLPLIIGLLAVLVVLVGASIYLTRKRAAKSS